MRSILITIFLIGLSLTSAGQIIADHTVVDRYDDIPQIYIEQVKKMLLVVAGESHSMGYMEGLESLESANPIYSVNKTRTPEPYSTSFLRISRTTWGDLNNESGWINDYGEEDWFTSTAAISRTKAGISYYASQGIPMSAFGFGWCYDGGYRDMTGYLDATQQYIDHCINRNYSTKVFFTTGPVDGLNAIGETGYYKYLAHESIRNYVKKEPSRILFDFADILCYDAGSSTPNTSTWNGYTFPVITSKNNIPEGIGHISPEGELRIAKAMWWMLARIAGWDGGISTVVPVSSINVSGAGGASIISTQGGTLQLTATVSPSNTTNKSVTWSITNGTGQALISSTGVVTAQSDGTVTARATANDGSGIYGSLQITITNQIISVSGITVVGANGSSSISSIGGTLQLTATVSPLNATNKSVTWSISDGTGQAIISSSGLVTAQSNGTVTARATANDGSGVYGTRTITISNQVTLVAGITVTGAGGMSNISIDDGTLQLSASVSPSNATNKSITWSISNGTGRATISQSGLVTAQLNGTVTARASANDGTGKFGQLLIEITNQTVHVSGIEIQAQGGERSLDDRSNLQLNAFVFPEDATNKTITWSLLSGQGYATINSNGLLTALSEGRVIVKAEANDGSGVFDTLALEIEKADLIKAWLSASEIKVHLPERFLNFRINLYGLNGHLYESKNINDSEMIFDASGLSPGIYLITVHNAIILNTIKIVKTQ